MTSFAAVLYVGRYKVVEAKRTYLHVLIHSAANSAEDARSNSPATGERPGFNSYSKEILEKLGQFSYQAHLERKRMGPFFFQIPKRMKASGVFEMHICSHMESVPFAIFWTRNKGLSWRV